MSPILVALLVTLAIAFATALGSAVVRGFQSEAVAAGRNVQGVPGLSGAGAAVAMLGEHAGNVRVRSRAGADAYDLRSSTIYLDAADFSGGDVAAQCLACHEAGHALWHAAHARGASALRALASAGRLAFLAWAALLVAAFPLASIPLAAAGIAFWALGVVCSLVLCALEADASSTALGFLRGRGLGDAPLASSRRILRLSLAAYLVASAGPLALFRI